MNKKRLLLIAVVIAAVAGYFVWDKMLRTAPSMKRLDAEYRVNAVDLHAEFSDNEDAANIKYQNQIIEVVGEVENVEAQEGRLPVIKLKADGFGVVECTLESQISSEELDKIKLNSTLVIRGECQGFLLIDVKLGRSIVIEPA